MKKHKKEIGYDKRPRFGWVDDLDLTPQHVYEEKVEDGHPVAVIPLPYLSSKIRKKILEFVNGTIWPSDALLN
jgi:hypothetical protein